MANVLPPNAMDPAPVSNDEVDDSKLTSTDVEPAPQPLDDAKLGALGVKLRADFGQYEAGRRQHEMQWAKNFRQYRGIYDDEIKIPKDRSRAYPKLTRVKCVSMVARLMNLLFPSNENNWTLAASPVPNLSTEDLQQILNGLMQAAQPAPAAPQPGQPPGPPAAPTAITDEMITDAVKTFASDRAHNLEMEILDQLTELGGARTVSYIGLCRRVLMSGVLYGAGILKGPFARKSKQRRWSIGENNDVQVIDDEVLLPQYEFVPIWDYYPDLSAKYLHQMDGQFQRYVMSRQQVRQLADNPDFLQDRVTAYLKANQKGNYAEKPFEREIRNTGNNTTTNLNDGKKYEIIVWDGMLSGQYLQGCGIEIAPEELSEMYDCIVWMIDDKVIRCALSPWEILGEDGPISRYHHFVFEEDEANLLGNGLPVIMRDSALSVAATARMILDNASVVCGPMLEINRKLLMAGSDVTGIAAYRTFDRDDEDPNTINVPAVRAVEVESRISELTQVNELFHQFADAETFVNPATGGDMQKGPSEPFRTAAGASMLQGAAALPFKDAVRGFDQFTESVIGSLVLFNKHFNTKKSIQGDFQTIARGSTSLIAKEVRGIGYDNLAASLKPEEALYIDWKKFLKARCVVRDIDAIDVMVDDAEAKRREDSQAQAQTQQQDQQNTLMEAQVKKLLADAMKALTQADKNTSNSDAQTYTAVTGGLKDGVAPADVAAARAGMQGPPAGAVAVHQIQHPLPQPAEAA